MAHSDPLREQSGSDTLRSLIQAVEALPTPPSVAASILAAVTEESDFEEVARLIAADPGTALKVLRLANSPAYNRQSKVSSLDKAMVVLGLGTLKTLLLGAFVRDNLLRDRAADDPWLTVYWKHSLACGATAQLLAERLRPEAREEAFVCGLLHDLGKAALLMLRAEAYERVLHAAEEGEDLCDLERSTFGADHALVGKWLAESWGLPQNLVESAWLHHQPELASPVKGGRLPVPVLVALADRICREAMMDYSSPDHLAVTMEMAGRAGIGEDVIDAVRPQVAARFAEKAELFDLDPDQGAFFAEALQRANAKLVRMGLGKERETSRLDRACAVAEAGTSLATILASTSTELRVAEGVQAEVFERLGMACAALAVFDPAGGEPRGLFWDGRKGSRLPATSGGLPTGCPQEFSVLLARRVYTPDPSSAGLEERLGRVLGLTLEFGGERLGDMLVVLPGEEGPAYDDLDLAGFRQIAGLAAANLHRLRLTAQLERRAEDLGQALAKLGRAKEKALQAERLAAVGQLAAGAAHEINNPLSIIYARAQLMEQKEAEPQKKRSLRQMCEQIERITGILQNLMDFARPAPPKLDDLDLGAAVDKSLGLLGESLAAAGIAVEKRLDPSLPPVKADAGQIQSLLVNLLINAQHAMEDRGGTIRLETGLGVGGGQVVLRVRDEGRGIPQEILGRVFEPFFTTKEAGKGTGLGLSICYGIVKGHGGSIEVRSEEGAWTEITVRLPLETPVKAHCPDKPAGMADFGPADVLVVDDEQSIRDILVESLLASGYTVHAAADGQEALERIARGSYRLVLMDIVMPRRDGLSVLQTLAARRPGLPVVVLTGIAGQPEIRRAMELGAKVCLRKPFQMEALLAKVSELIGAAKKTGEGA